MFDKILFATTGTPICDNAAHVAFDIAKKYNSTLHMFHVLGLPSRGFGHFVVDVRTGEKESYDLDYISWVKEELKNTYDKYLATCKTCEIDSIAGVPHTEVLRKARKIDADLIVMGAHSRQEETGATRYRGAVGTNMQKVAKPQGQARQRKAGERRRRGNRQGKTKRPDEGRQKSSLFREPEEGHPGKGWGRHRTGRNAREEKKKPWPGTPQGGTDSLASLA